MEFAWFSLTDVMENSGLPPQTIENGAVFDRFGFVFYRFGAVFYHLGRRNEALEFDSNCQAPQRAWQFESNSNAKVYSIAVHYSAVQQKFIAMHLLCHYAVIF